MAKTSERDRYEYGVCINRDKDGKPCPKCDTKEVQKIRKGQDFSCEECKERMRKVPPPKPPISLGMIIGIAVVAVILLGIGAYIVFSSGNKEKAPTSDVEILVTPIENVNDTVEPATTNEPGVGEEKKNDSIKIQPPSPKYAFGRYEGKLRNGIPEGQGTMYYTCRVQIAKHGRITYYAESGDTFVGTWGNGDIVNGNLFDPNNNQKAAILAGKRPSPYDLRNDKCE